jgi:hypothetical protein
MPVLLLLLPVWLLIILGLGILGPLLLVVVLLFFGWILVLLCSHYLDELALFLGQDTQNCLSISGGYLHLQHPQSSCEVLRGGPSDVILSTQQAREALQPTRVVHHASLEGIHEGSHP